MIKSYPYKGNLIVDKINDLKVVREYLYKTAMNNRSMTKQDFATIKNRIELCDSVSCALHEELRARNEY